MWPVVRYLLPLLFVGVIHELLDDGGFEVVDVLVWAGLLVVVVGFFELADRAWPDHVARDRAPRH